MRFLIRSGSAFSLRMNRMKKAILTENVDKQLSNYKSGRRLHIHLVRMFITFMAE